MEGARQNDMSKQEPDYYMIRNWDKFQHYKHRSMVWVKLYNSLLTDVEFRRMADPAKLLYYSLLLYASLTNNKIPAELAHIRDICGIRTKPKYFQELIENRYLIPYGASNALEPGYTDAMTEKKRVEKSREEKKREEKKRRSKPIERQNLDDSDSQSGNENWKKTWSTLDRITAGRG
jgi:hypothetical protein